MDNSIVSRPANVGERLITIRPANTAGCVFAAVGKPEEALRLLHGTQLRFDKPIKYYGRFGRLRFGGRTVATFHQAIDASTNIQGTLELQGGRIVTLTELTPDQTATVIEVPSSAAV